MFGKFDLRYKLAIVWIAGFLLLWFIFYSTFRADSLKYDLDQIIKGIENADWEQADKFTAKFSNNYCNRKYIYQINNSTEMFATFEYSVRQLKLAVRNRQESALEYAGLLREGINFVAEPFTGP